MCTAECLPDNELAGTRPEIHTPGAKRTQVGSACNCNNHGAHGSSLSVKHARIPVSWHRTLISGYCANRLVQCLTEQYLYA